MQDSRGYMLRMMFASAGLSGENLEMAVKVAQTSQFSAVLAEKSDLDALCEPGWSLPRIAAYWANRGKLALTFDDVTLEQDFSENPNRRDVNTVVQIAPGLSMQGFLVTSPMPDVTWFPMATAMADIGMLGCVHRMPMADWWIDPGMKKAEAKKLLDGLKREDIEQMVIAKTTQGFGAFLQKGYTPDQIVMSVSYRTYMAGHVDRLWEIAERYGRLHVLIETANGDSSMVLGATADLRKKFGEKIVIGGGNFTTGAAMVRAAKAGMNWGRATIGPGRLCTTRRVAAVGVPTITGIAQAAEMLRREGLLYRESGRGMLICHDGGTNCLGDRTKALCAGADFSMAGSSMAMCLESGAQHFEVDGKHFIHVRGNASKELVQSVRPEDWRKIAAEGGKATVAVDPENPVTAAQYWDQAKSAFGSTCGYFGVGSIADLRVHHRGWRVTTSGLSEGKAVLAEGTSKAGHF